MIYPGEDPDAYYTGWYRYYMTGDPTGFNNAGYLILNEIDTATDTLIRTKKAVIPFDTNMLDDHGYGKPSAVVDLQARKIYCIYDGGYGGSVYPAYFAWFIYDLDTNEWEPTCHTLNIEHRKDYYNLYPDGNGGAIFIIQRCVVAEYSPEIIGVQITGAGFAWDSVYYYHIKDMEAVNFYNSGNLEQDRQHDRELYDYVEYPISVPDYQLSAGKYYPITASHYGNNGCTYRDTNGNIHVIYTESYPKKHPKQSTTTYHVIMDTSTDTEIFREMIPTSLLPNNGAKSGYDAGMGFTMTQGPDGKFYIFHFKTSSNNVQVEVFSSPADDGRNFTKAIAAQFLTTRDGTKVTGGYPIIGNSRDGSIRDGIIPMIFNSSTNPASGSTETYYYFSVEVPCSHCWSGWEVTVPPTATDAGEETRTCSFCGATETRPISGPVCTASLSLNDSVDINIYVDNVTADLVSDGYSVEYGPDGDKTQVAFSAAEPVSEGRYKFTVASFNANQLSRNVYLNVLDGSGQPVKFIRYSVKDYCDTVLNDPSADEGLQNVCSALMAYGWYAQERFPEGKGPDFDPEPYSDAISAVEALGIEGMGDYETHAEYSSLVSGVSASLVLKSKTDLNFFIKGVSDVGDITLTVDGHNWTDYEAVTSETKCRITVRGLSPVVYASDVILVCEGANVTYSPMAYLKRVVESGESDCINVCKALYLYAAAAMNFFNP